MKGLLGKLVLRPEVLCEVDRCVDFRLLLEQKLHGLELVAGENERPAGRNQSQQRYGIEVRSRSK